MHHVVLFVNPLLAGRGRRHAAVERCAAFLRGERCVVEMRYTLSARSAGEQAREAVEDGVDTIFVCGGDGTFFQVLQGVAGSDTALGILPFGTGNVLAQNLGLPRDPFRALRAQMRTEAVSIALGEVTCAVAGAEAVYGERRCYFAIAAGMGLHAALMSLGPNGAGKRLLGRSAYYAGGARLLSSYPVQPFEVETIRADGETSRFRACELLGVRVPAINRWRPGGNLCSSQLRMAAVPQTSRLGLGHAMIHALIAKSRGGRATGAFGLSCARYEDTTEIVCTPVAGFSYRTPLLVEADGEVIGVERARFRMAEARLQLLWPGGAT